MRFSPIRYGSGTSGGPVLLDGATGQPTPAHLPVPPVAWADSPIGAEPAWPAGVPAILSTIFGRRCPLHWRTSRLPADRQRVVRPDSRRQASCCFRPARVGGVGGELVTARTRRRRRGGVFHRRVVRRCRHCAARPAEGVPTRRSSRCISPGRTPRYATTAASSSGCWRRSWRPARSRAR